MRAYVRSRQASVRVYAEEQKALVTAAMGVDEVDEVSGRFGDKMTMQESTIRLCKNFLPRNLNGIGTIFGGDLLEWMEKAAVMCASNFTRNPNVVTIAMDRVFFKTPISVDHVLELSARVIYTRKHTLQVETLVHAYLPEWVRPAGKEQDEKDGSSPRAFSHKGYFTIISLTEYGHKRPIGVALDLRHDAEAQLAYLKAHHRFQFWHAQEMRTQEALRDQCITSSTSFYSSARPPWEAAASSS